VAEQSNSSREENGGVRSAPPQSATPQSAKANWVPTVVMLGILVWWLLVTYVIHVYLPTYIDLAVFVTYLIIAAIVVIATPAIELQLAPESSSAARRLVQVLVYVVAAVPLGIMIFWSAHNVVTPVQPRAELELPNIGSLVGRSQHDVARILGQEKVVGEAALSSGENADPSRPGGAQAQRLVVYSLPDLNTLQFRAAKQTARQAESKGSASKFGGAPTPADWNSDAVVIVYYDSSSKAVGVRADVSERAAKQALSYVTSQTVLAAMGVKPSAAVTETPRGVGPPPSENYWGSATAGNQVVGYELQLGGFANFLGDRTAVFGGPGTDQGDVTLVIAPNLTDPSGLMLADASSPGPTGDQTADAQVAQVPVDEQDAATPDSGAADAASVPRGSSSFSDRTFYVIVCSGQLSSEDDANQAASQLNAQVRKGRPCFTVERSGHLEGLGTKDFWVVIYDVGYIYGDAARKTIADQPWGFDIPGASAVEITKVCGDYTIYKIVG